MESCFCGVYSASGQVSINGANGQVKVAGRLVTTCTPATLRAEAAKAATSTASAIPIEQQDECRVRYAAFAPLAAPAVGGCVMTFGRVLGGLGADHANPGLIVRLSAAEAATIAAGGSVT